MTIQQIFEQHWNLYFLLGICMIGTMGKIFVSLVYRKLIKEAENMGHSTHKLMKTLSMKFDTCYQLKIGVSNVETFVDKYVYSYKMLGVHLYTWENLCGQILIITMIFSVSAEALAIGLELGKSAVLSTLIIGVLAGGWLIFIDNILNLHMKKEILCIHIKDYLENICKPRLENQIFYPEKMKEYHQEYFEEEKEELNKVLDVVKPKESFDFEFSKEEKSIIEEVLNEYMA